MTDARKKRIRKFQFHRKILFYSETEITRSCSIPMLSLDSAVQSSTWLSFIPASSCSSFGNNRKSALVTQSTVSKHCKLVVERGFRTQAEVTTPGFS